MTAIGQRILDRWDSGTDHDGLTATMLDRALTLGWISQADYTARTT